MPFPAACLCYDAEEEMVDYYFFYCSRAVQIWRMVDLLQGVIFMDSLIQFFIRAWSLIWVLRRPRFQDIQRAYMAYISGYRGITRFLSRGDFLVDLSYSGL